jgi:hypothetical protein
MIEAEAQLEQEFALDDAGGDPGVAGGRADGAEEDRVSGAEVGECCLGQGLPRLEPVLRPQRVGGLLQDDAFGGGCLFQDLQGFGYDLRADAVARDDGQINRGCAHVFRVAKGSTFWSSRLTIRTPRPGGPSPPAAKRQSLPHLWRKVRERRRVER